MSKSGTVTRPSGDSGPEAREPTRSDATDGSADARVWREAWSRRAPSATAGGVAFAERRTPVTLAIVIPCFDEEDVLPTTIERLAELRQQLLDDGLVREESAVWFVDDGSRDSTWSIIEHAASVLPWVHGLKLSRNRGHQHALLAGLLTAPGDVVISVDADLQDDLGAMREMLLAHARGAEVVYGVRAVRRSDTAFKRTTAELYYRLLAAFGVNVVFNHADYRLLSRRAIEALGAYGEANLFLRGIIPQLGFPTATVEYERAARFAGESKYPVRKMLALAWDGLTSFSAVPLRWITAFGFVVSLLSFAVGCWAIWVRLRVPESVPGWASTLVPIAFLGGIQLVSIGVIGEYVGKTYVETKRRPRFIIEKSV